MNTIHFFDDDQLIGPLRTSNELAIAEMYNCYRGKLYYIAHKLLKDTDTAEEIVQHVLLYKKENPNH